MTNLRSCMYQSVRTLSAVLRIFAYVYVAVGVVCKQWLSDKDSNQLVLELESI